jgi:hypothetical protein
VNPRVIGTGGARRSPSAQLLAQHAQFLRDLRLMVWFAILYAETSSFTSL